MIMTPEYIILEPGPAHPAAHGVLSVCISILGGRIYGLDILLGLLHRASEKLIEMKHPQKSLQYFERLDYVDSTLNHLITYEQNNSIKIFTIVSLFFMPPMLIASIYGMNFKNMPELNWEYGYPLAILSMLVTFIFTFYYFKTKKWL